MLMLRMISGLLVWALRPLMPRGRKKFAAAEDTGFRPEGTIHTASTGFFRADGKPSGDPCLGHAREMEPNRNTERLEKAAEWHAKAARRAVIDRDGEGALQHMRNFRRYSGALVGTDEPFARSPRLRPGACIGCGSTCAKGDLSPATATCFACDPARRHGRPCWTARDGRNTPVEEMDDGHLENSALMVGRWLRDGSRPVTDDRIRMTGHVLEECAKRGINLSYAGILKAKHGRQNA